MPSSKRRTLIWSLVMLKSWMYPNILLKSWQSDNASCSSLSFSSSCNVIRSLCIFVKEVFCFLTSFFMFWWTLLVPQSFLFPDTYTSSSMFDSFSLKILEGGIFILFLYVCFSILLFSPFIWRKAKAPVLWLTFPMNTVFPKRLLFSLIVIFTLQSHPSTLQVASHLKYGDSFRYADFLKCFLNTQTQ